MKPGCTPNIVGPIWVSYRLLAGFVASAVVCSKGVVLLLLIHCLLLFPSFVGVLYVILCSMQCFVSFLVLHHLVEEERERESWLLYFNCALAVMCGC